MKVTWILFCFAVVLVLLVVAESKPSTAGLSSAQSSFLGHNKNKLSLADQQGVSKWKALQQNKLDQVKAYVEALTGASRSSESRSDTLSSISGKRIESGDISSLLRQMGGRGLSVWNAMKHASIFMPWLESKPAVSQEPNCDGTECENASTSSSSFSTSSDTVSARADVPPVVQINGTCPLDMYNSTAGGPCKYYKDIACKLDLVSPASDCGSVYANTPSILLLDPCVSISSKDLNYIEFRVRAQCTLMSVPSNYDVAKDPFDYVFFEYTELGVLAFSHPFMSNVSVSLKAYNFELPFSDNRVKKVVNFGNDLDYLIGKKDIVIPVDLSIVTSNQNEYKRFAPGGMIYTEIMFTDGRFNRKTRTSVVRLSIVLSDYKEPLASSVPFPWWGILLITLGIIMIAGLAAALGHHVMKKKVEEDAAWMIPDKIPINKRKLD